MCCSSVSTVWFMQRHAETLKQGPTHSEQANRDDSEPVLHASTRNIKLLSVTGRHTRLCFRISSKQLHLKHLSRRAPLIKEPMRRWTSLKRFVRFLISPLNCFQTNSARREMDPDFNTWCCKNWRKEIPNCPQSLSLSSVFFTLIFQYFSIKTYRFGSNVINVVDARHKAVLEN